MKTRKGVARPKVGACAVLRRELRRLGACSRKPRQPWRGFSTKSPTKASKLSLHIKRRRRKRPIDFHFQLLVLLRRLLRKKMEPKTLPLHVQPLRVRISSGVIPRTITQPGLVIALSGRHAQHAGFHRD